MIQTINMKQTTGRKCSSEFSLNDDCQVEIRRMSRNSQKKGGTSSNSGVGTKKCMCKALIKKTRLTSACSGSKGERHDYSLKTLSELSE